MDIATIDRSLVFPNVENLFVGFLGTRSELTGVTVGSELPSPFGGDSRAVVVTRVGGAFNEDDRLDVARVRVDAYALSKGVAHAVACVVRGVLPLIPQTRLAGGTVVADVSEEQGPYWVRDAEHTEIHRYLMRYRLVIKI
jgi:hypothetical protein